MKFCAYANLDKLPRMRSWINFALYKSADEAGAEAIG